jgi:flavin-dependent dehydrogenase
MNGKPRKDGRVIIIGASLAGSMAAIELARAGLSVTLIDKESFPRRKPCGEGLSARGQAELTAAGCSLNELSCECRPLNGYRIFHGARSLEIPDEAGLVGVSRMELDNRLLSYAARFPSIEIVVGSKATVLESRTGHCKVRARGCDFVGDTLIVADGAVSPIIRSLGRTVRVPRSPRLGTSSSWGLVRGELSSKVHTVLVRGGEIYLTPLSNGVVNVSALGDRSLIQPFAQERSLRVRIEAIAERIGVSLEPINSPLSCGAINTIYRGASLHGAYVIGDACETFDPCAGFGMAHALISGRLAAQCVTRGLGELDPAAALRAYEVEREDRVRDVRGFTRLTSATMTSGLGRMSLPLLVSTGLAARVSRSVHAAHEPDVVRHVVSLLGGRSRSPHAEAMPVS